MVRVTIQLLDVPFEERVGAIEQELKKRGVVADVSACDNGVICVETTHENVSEVIAAAKKLGMDIETVYIDPRVERKIRETLAVIEKLTDEIRGEISVADEVLRELRKYLTVEAYEEVREKLEEMRRRVKKIADAIEEAAEEVRRALWG